MNFFSISISVFFFFLFVFVVYCLIYASPVVVVAAEKRTQETTRKKRASKNQHRVENPTDHAFFSAVAVVANRRQCMRYFSHTHHSNVKPFVLNIKTLARARVFFS